MSFSEVVYLILIFVTSYRVVVDINHEGIKYENICYSFLEYIVINCIWTQLTFHLR